MKGRKKGEWIPFDKENRKERRGEDPYTIMEGAFYKAWGSEKAE